MCKSKSKKYLSYLLDFWVTTFKKKSHFPTPKAACLQFWVKQGKIVGYKVYTPLRVYWMVPPWVMDLVLVKNVNYCRGPLMHPVSLQAYGICYTQRVQREASILIFQHTNISNYPRHTPSQKGTLLQGPVRTEEVFNMGMKSDSSK